MASHLLHRRVTWPATMLNHHNYPPDNLKLSPRSHDWDSFGSHWFFFRNPDLIYRDPKNNVESFCFPFKFLGCRWTHDIHHDFLHHSTTAWSKSGFRKNLGHSVPIALDPSRCARVSVSLLHKSGAFIWAIAIWACICSSRLCIWVHMSLLLKAWLANDTSPIWLWCLCVITVAEPSSCRALGSLHPTASDPSP